MMRFICIVFTLLELLTPGICTGQTAIVQVQPSVEDRFPKRIGNLRFSATTLHLGDVLNNQLRTDTIKMYNAWNSPLTISSGLTLPDYMKMNIVPAKLGPSEEGMIIINYDAAKKQEFGFVFERLLLITNDALQGDKNLNITASIKEYFPPPVPGDTVAPQRVRVPETSHYIGPVTQGDKKTHGFTVFNDGQKDLIIHHAKTDCGCVSVEIPVKTVPPGSSAVINLEFDSFGKDGDVFVEVIVFVNDPVQPEIRFRLQADVRK